MDDDEQAVKIEVDASSLTGAFDNIAQGFKDHGNEIRKLKYYQGALGLGVILANIGAWTLQ